MSTDQSTNLGLPYLMPAQAQKHVTVNESLLRLDALVQTAVESRAVTAQPGSPADGAVWIVPSGKTGPEWGGYADGSLAYYRDGAWESLTPREGWRAWVKDEDLIVTWTGSDWSGATVSNEFATLEIGHASDTTVSRSAAGVLAVEGGVIPKENRANIFTAAQAININGSTAANANADDFVVRVENGVAGITVISGDSGQAYLALGNTSQPIDGFVAYDATSNELRFGIGANVRVTMAAGGSVWGSATGGAKGAGTINAQGVYDDNTLLSCYVFDAALDGRIDLAKWDGLVPSVADADGATLQERTHEPARKFVARLGGEHDPLTLDGYAKHWKEKRHLTALPNEASFDPLVGLPAGAWIQRLVETVEIQAVLIEQLNQRIKALEEATA